MSDVNGFHDNYRYVAPAVTGKLDYLHLTAEPIFLALVEQLSVQKPVPGTIQKFAIAVFSSYPIAPAYTGPSATDLDVPTYFSTYADPFLTLLLTTVATAEPGDIKVARCFPPLPRTMIDVAFPCRRSWWIH